MIVGGSAVGCGSVGCGFVGGSSAGGSSEGGGDGWVSGEMRSLLLAATGTGSLVGFLLSGPGSEVGLCTASGISSAFNVKSNQNSFLLIP